MKRMSIITPSYAPDFELCADLHRSVLEYSPSSVHHHIIVPRSDLKLFGRLAGPRTHIRCETDVLPRCVRSSTVHQRHRQSDPAVPTGSWLDPATGA